MGSIQSRKGKAVQAVRFRNKVTGWKNSHFTTVYEDGSVDTAPLFATEFGRAFGRALFLRPSCHRCAYTSMSRPGDFTLGDLWGLRSEGLAEQQAKGISLLMVNTPQGSYLLDQLRLVRKPFPAERAIVGNPRLASPIPPRRSGRLSLPPTLWSRSRRCGSGSSGCRRCPCGPRRSSCRRR